MRRSRIEKRRRAADKTKCRKHFVEFNSAIVLLLAFKNGQPQGNSHPEILRRFKAQPLVVDQIPIINGLDSHVSELLIPIEPQRARNSFQIKLQQLWREAAYFDAARNVGWKVFLVLKPELSGSAERR